MGQVRLIRNRITGVEYAAKTIRPEYLRDAEAIRRFQREKRILASLDHPNIVRLHEVFMDEHGGVFVMDYMPGGDLGGAINSQNTSNMQLADFFDGIAAGVSHTHQQGIVHRDLKPGNVLMDTAGNARISDFGLAVLTNRDTTPLTLVGGMGTRWYAAPEQMIDAANVDYRADIYALGYIAYEIATRESPYSPPTLSTGDADLDALLKRSLHRDRERRTATTQELSGALRAYLMKTPASK
jgi:serine/threonine protein kinase